MIKPHSTSTNNVRKFFVICLSSCFAPMRMPTQGVCIFSGMSYFTDPRDNALSRIRAAPPQPVTGRYERTMTLCFWLPATVHARAHFRMDTKCAQCQCLPRQLCICGGSLHWQLN
jgi:hypothetical protein